MFLICYKYNDKIKVEKMGKSGFCLLTIDILNAVFITLPLPL